MSKAASRLVFSASMLSIALATPAFAQGTPADSTPQDAAAADEAPDAGAIVVTGSLIQRPNNTAVSPIVTVSEQALKEAGTPNLEDALNQLPSFTTAGNANTGGQGTGGRASVNLHGLGSNRNLVLLDGKRLPLSDINGNVDPNILPESIVSGVDVITGGAGAVYGSDAISGVVNFKTVRSLEGVRVDAMNTISERGDGYKFNGSLAFGSNFQDGRGHVVAAFSYTKQDAINGSSRPFYFDKTPSSFLGTSTFVPSAVNAPNAAVVAALYAKYGVTTLPANFQLANEGFNNDGTLFIQNGAQNYRGPTNGNGYLVIANNVRMPVGQQVDFQNALKRKTAFVKADYDLTPDLTLYGQFLYVDLTVHTASGGSLTQFGTINTVPLTNPFIPADLRTVLASRANAAAPFTINGRYLGVPYKNWDENYQVQQYQAGLRGNIVPGWTFDAFASYDETVHNQTLHSGVVKSKVQQLLNAADGGASLCAGGYNPFGANNVLSLSQACQTFITKDAVSVEHLGQTQVQAQVNGKLFDLGAGPAQIALVANYRKNTYDYTPDSDLAAQNIEAVIASAAVPKSTISVKEVAAQIDIPLISNKPFFHEFGIGGAIRYSDYRATQSGSALRGGFKTTSYEFDARWKPIEQLLIRGSYQRAVRAPNIAELFSPASGSQLVIGTPPGSLGDPCDIRSTARTGANAAQVTALCQAQGIPAAALSSYQFPTTATGQLISGNPAVTPERADTFNVGFVFNPRGSGILSDFNISVDYYNIKIKNVISTVPGLTVLSKCFNLDGTNPTYDATNLYCKLVQRDATGQLLQVVTPFLNLGSLKTDGVEVQAHLGVPATFASPSGKVYVDAGMNFLRNYKVQLLPGAPFLNYTGVSNGAAGTGVPPRATPTFKSLTTVGYRSDSVGVGLRWRYQNGMKDVSAVLTPANVAVGVGSYSLFDLFASIKVMKQFELRGGVNNLTDRGLPFVASSQNGTDSALYDSVGRTYYIGAKVAF